MAKLRDQWCPPSLVQRLMEWSASETAGTLLATSMSTSSPADLTASPGVCASSLEHPRDGRRVAAGSDVPVEDALVAVAGDVGDLGGEATRLVTLSASTTADEPVREVPGEPVGGDQPNRHADNDQAQSALAAASKLASRQQSLAVRLQQVTPCRREHQRDGSHQPGCVPTDAHRGRNVRHEHVDQHRRRHNSWDLRLATTDPDGHCGGRRGRHSPVQGAKG